MPGLKTCNERLERIETEKAAWEEELGRWTHETDPWSLQMATGESRYMHPREMLPALERALPSDVMVSRTDIGNICSVASSISASTGQARCSLP